MIMIFKGFNHVQVKMNFFIIYLHTKKSVEKNSLLMIIELNLISIATFAYMRYYVVDLNEKKSDRDGKD